MRLLYLDWPHLPLRLALGRDPAPDELVVLGGRAWDPGSVLDGSPAAARIGVRRGQPLGVAHGLAPDALFLPAQPDAYRDAFESALDALVGLAPAVEGETDPAAGSFGRVLLGIEGLSRLWGDEASLARRAVDLMAPLLPGRPRMGIGNTRFGAQVAAVTGVGAVSTGVVSVGVIPPGGPREEATFLAPLPVSLLPADPDTRERLRLFGLTRMGDLADLDRSAVAARFGALGGRLHDLTRGLDDRPLRPRRPLERIRAEVELEPAVETLEPLRFVLHRLCGTLCEQLAARGAGARVAVMTLTLETSAVSHGPVAHAPGSRAPVSGADPTTLRYEQALPEPTAAVDLLERLLMARLLATPPDAPVERLSLELDGVAPAGGQQLTLFTPQLARAGRLDWQLTGLAVRFGPDRILRARMGDPEDQLAERRFTWHRAVES